MNFHTKFLRVGGRFLVPIKNIFCVEQNQNEVIISHSAFLVKSYWGRAERHAIVVKLESPELAKECFERISKELNCDQE